MELGNLPDIVHQDILKIEDLPDKAVEVLALKALGLKDRKIARLMKMSHSSVQDYLKRYDPNGLCRIDSTQRRVITTEMLMATGVEALTEITDAKLQEMDANKLSAIAARCVNTAEKIRMLDKGIKERKTELDAAMDWIDAEFEAEDTES